MIRNYPKGQIIFFKGDSTNYLYRLIYGAIKVYSISDIGNEHILVIRSAPDIFPLSLLIGLPEAMFFYEALTDVKLEMITPDSIETNEIMKQSIILFYESLHRIAALEARTVRERAEATLSYFKEHGIERPTHQLIADASNASRESISTNLKKPKSRKKKNARS